MEVRIMKLSRRVFSGILSLILLLCSFGMLVTTSDLTVMAQNENDFVNTNGGNHECYCAAGNGVYVSLETEKNHFSNDENVSVAYYVNSEDSITDISYTQVGFNVISVGVDESDSHRVMVELSCISSSTSYSVSVQIMLSNGKSLTAMLYATKNEYGVFISPFSEDDACENFCTEYNEGTR